MLSRRIMMMVERSKKPLDEGVTVVASVALCLAHVPDLVRYGSKPSRDIGKNPNLLSTLRKHRRTYEEALRYPPNQVFIGNMRPDALWDIAKPWFDNPLPQAQGQGPHGEIMSQADFYCLMKVCDDFDMLWLSKSFVSAAREGLSRHPLMTADDLKALGEGRPAAEIDAEIGSGAGISIHMDEAVVGCLRHGHPEDVSLEASILLENLAAKASAVLALRHALNKVDGVMATDIDYLLGCGEEAVGDRYQRSGGSLSKAVAEKAGCVNATGSDVKAFCCAPNHAVIIGAAVIKGGLFRKVAVVGGGSLAKLGMKYEGHLKHEMPILEDTLAAVAIVLASDDGISPMIDLECVGKHDIAAGSSQQAIADSIVVKPLARCGLRLIDVDRFATELHNPEITEPQGSGNVPRTNYRLLANLAVQRGEISREQIEAFVHDRGMPGFSPTQGHIASAIPFLGHARDQLISGEIERAFFFAKGSLFLGRMTQMSDGLSFLLRRNPQQLNGGTREAV
jgi:hypothetical protein